MNIEKEILIPVTNNILLPGKLDVTDYVFVSVGAGYVVEKTVPDAQDYFSSQTNLLDGSIKTMRSQAMSIEDQMYAVKKVYFFLNLHPIFYLIHFQLLPFLFFLNLLI